MLKIDPNAPAFPHLHDSCQRINESEHWEGLTKREEFVKAAMLGILARVPLHSFSDVNLPDEIAVTAICYADALIDALNKEEPIASATIPADTFTKEGEYKMNVTVEEPST